MQSSGLNDNELMGRINERHGASVLSAGAIHGGFGQQVVLMFPNNLGASVVRSEFSYGGENGLYELAVIRRTDSDEREWVITYDTPITNDVEGWLTPEGVLDLLAQIEALPARTPLDWQAYAAAREARLAMLLGHPE